MATNPRIGQVDHLLDEAQLAREDLHGRVQKLRCDCLRVRHMAREMYDEIMDLERELAGANEQSEGGELFRIHSDLRSHRAIRKARNWDGTDRRKRRDDRHLEAVA